MDGRLGIPPWVLQDIGPLAQSLGPLPLKTRPDTRLPQSRAGGQGPYMRSHHHLSTSCEVKYRKTPNKVKYDQPMDRLTDGPTDGWTDKAGCRVAKHATKDYSCFNLYFLKKTHK